MKGEYQQNISKVYFLLNGPCERMHIYVNVVTFCYNDIQIILSISVRRKECYDQQAYVTWHDYVFALVAWVMWVWICSLSCGIVFGICRHTWHLSGVLSSALLVSSFGDIILSFIFSSSITSDRKINENVDRTYIIVPVIKWMLFFQ